MNIPITQFLIHCIHYSWINSIHIYLVHFWLWFKMVLKTCIFQDVKKKMIVVIWPCVVKPIAWKFYNIIFGWVSKLVLGDLIVNNLSTIVLTICSCYKTQVVWWYWWQYRWYSPNMMIFFLFKFWGSWTICGLTYNCFGCRENFLLLLASFVFQMPPVFSPFFSLGL